MEDPILDQILSRDAQWRYRFTLRVARQTGELSALATRTHWMIVGRMDRQPLFPVWPSYEIARSCTERYWPALRPSVFEFDDWCGEWFDALERRGIPIEIFPTDAARGVQVSPVALARDLESIWHEQAVPIPRGATDAERLDLAGRPLSSPGQSVSDSPGWMTRVDND